METNLNGTWKGQIQSTWVHPKTGKLLEPIPVILTIFQADDALSCTMRTAEMTSVSHQESLTTDPKTRITTLAYHYVSTPNSAVKDRSPIHEGTMKFQVVEAPTSTLTRADSVIH